MGDKMNLDKAKAIIEIIRSSQRPWLVLIFPLAIVIIAVLAVFTLLPLAAKFIDRDIAMVIVVAVLGILGTVSSATVTIMAFLFGERAAKRAAETPVTPPETKPTP